jgi:hypothetical protein
MPSRTMPSAMAWNVILEFLRSQQRVDEVGRKRHRYISQHLQERHSTLPSFASPTISRWVVA